MPCLPCGGNGVMSVILADKCPTVPLQFFFTVLICPGLGCWVTHFICVKCTPATVKYGLILNRASVCRHIAASRPCKDVHLSFREFQVQDWAGDVMVRGGGAARPAPSIRHQAPGEETRRVTKTLDIYFDYHLHYIHALRSWPVAQR